MAELAAIILLILCIAYISYPFFIKSVDGDVFEQKERSDLLLRKENLLKAIKEIEFDLKMGKISEEDYRDMKARFKEELIYVYRELDKKVGKHAEVQAEDEIEKEIRAIRRRKG